MFPPPLDDLDVADEYEEEVEQLCMSAYYLRLTAPCFRTEFGATEAEKAFLPYEEKELEVLEAQTFGTHEGIYTATTQFKDYKYFTDVIKDKASPTMKKKTDQVTLLDAMKNLHWCIKNGK